MKNPFPVIDLFSGPGGLAEGFAAPDKNDHRQFRIALSVEKDAAAHRTLRLRAFLRKFQTGFPDEYYAYLNGSISQEPDWAELYRRQWEEANRETPCVELGTSGATSLIRKRVGAIRDRHKDRAVLLGGPPCQAYSVVGRARNAGNSNYDIHKDKRLLLYKKYAEALEFLQPPIAVMENVKGILSARYNGASIFEDVMKSLQNAGGERRYKLFALSPETENRSWTDGLDPTDFLVRTEEHGVPQRRHRVFVICIRSDVAEKLPENLFPKLESRAATVTVSNVIGAMPVLRSRLSRGDDAQSWQIAVKAAHQLVGDHPPSHQMSSCEKKKFREALKLASESARGKLLPFRDESNIAPASGAECCPQQLLDWLCDDKLKRLPNNETRGHIPEDIARYLYAATFAKTFSRSPRATDFPDKLAPNHASWKSGKFADRFRVQLFNQPATTITSHISKDGHYFIHPDPGQCRSLTVREAARLQTFPDNYLFLGGRTQQYVQVGNAVPPYLAWQIAECVAQVLLHWGRKRPTVPRTRQIVSSKPRNHRSRAGGMAIGQ